MGARAHTRSRTTQARRASGKDAPAAGDGRASVWHHQSPHGCHALSDEDTAASCLRDGAARTRLQSHPCHEHHGYSARLWPRSGHSQPLTSVRPVCQPGRAFPHDQDPKATSASIVPSCRLSCQVVSLGDFRWSEMQEPGPRCPSMSASVTWAQSCQGAVIGGRTEL